MSMPYFPSPSEVAVLLIDIQAGIIDFSKTNPGKTVRKAAEGVSRIAAMLSIPVFISLIPTDEKTPEPVDELAGWPEFTRHFAGSFNQPEIRNAVAASGRKVLAIGGIISEIAVLHGGLTAIREGYTVYVLADCCGGVTERTEGATFAQLREAGAVITSVAGFFTMINGDFSQPQGAEMMKVMHAMLAKES